jgi:hypothetical protein
MPILSPKAVRANLDYFNYKNMTKEELIKRYRETVTVKGMETTVNAIIEAIEVSFDVGFQEGYSKGIIQGADLQTKIIQSLSNR